MLQLHSDPQDLTLSPFIAKSNVKVCDPLIVGNIDIMQFADEKTSWKILQQARQQQEELQEEFGLTRYLW